MDGDRANGEVNLYNNVTFTQFVTHSSFPRQPNDRPPPIRPTDLLILWKFLVGRTFLSCGLKESIWHDIGMDIVSLWIDRLNQINSQTSPQNPPCSLFNPFAPPTLVLRPSYIAAGVRFYCIPIVYV